MAEHQIRWSKGDLISLGKAISNFNKTKNNLESMQGSLGLPEELSFNQEKQRIKTRKELNRFKNSIAKFNEETAKLIETRGGELITNWEYSELKKKQKRVVKNLENELRRIHNPNTIFPTQKELKLENTLLNIKNFDILSKGSFERSKERIDFMGRSDYEFRKALVYRENYLKVMERYKNFEGYDELLAKMNSIKNPIEFYEKIRDNELVADLTYQSHESYAQTDFTRFVEMWGVETEIDTQDEYLEYLQTRRKFLDLEKRGFFESKI